MNKKRFILVVALIVLIIFMILITILKFNNKKENEVNSNNVEIYNELENTVWVKEHDEYKKGQDMSVEAAVFCNSNYIYFEKQKLVICNDLENQTEDCKQYNYELENGALILYGSRNNDIRYIYDINDDKLTIKYNKDNYIIENYYQRSNG